MASRARIVGGGGQSANHRFNYFGTAFKTALGGFRENSTQDDAGFTGKFGMTIDDRSTLSLVTAYDHSTQRVPGELTSDEMAANPRQANPVAMAFGGTSLAQDEFRFGGTYRRDFTAAQVEATGYYTPRGVAYLNIETLRLNQHFVNRGASAHLVVPSLFGTPARVTTGIDYQNTPITTGSFGRGNTSLAGRSLSEARGVRHDPGPLCPGRCRARRTRLRHGRLALRPHHVLDREPDPSAGRPLRHRVRTALAAPRPHVPADTGRGAVYSSYNEGFEAPDSRPVAQLAGARRRVRGQPHGEAVRRARLRGRCPRTDRAPLTFEASAYRQRTNNLIVAQSFLRPPPLTGQFSAVVNAGKVDQNGLELGVTLRPLTGMQMTGSYTYSDFTYRDFVTGGAELLRDALSPACRPTTSSPK